MVAANGVVRRMYENVCLRRICAHAEAMGSHRELGGTKNEKIAGAQPGPPRRKRFPWGAQSGGSGHLPTFIWRDQ